MRKNKSIKYSSSNGSKSAEKWVSDGLSFYYLLSSFNRKTYSRSFTKTGIINNSFLDDSILPLLPSPYLTDSQMSLGKEHVLLFLQKKKISIK